MIPSAPHDSRHPRRTLWLCAILHGFTHIYQVALLPLYLLIQQDLGLISIEKVTVLLSLMGAAYFLPSYPMGILADRFSRKRLMSLGLVVNSLGFIGLAFASSYPVAMLCVVLAGFGGSFYHPSATALVARLFPVATGKALGWVGVGASCGFFVGPLYSGWRAASSGWRAPVLELGAAGLLTAFLFQRLADEESTGLPSSHPHRPAEQLFPRPALFLYFFGASLAFSLRDFAGSGMGTLTSLFLAQARGFSTTSTGLALAGMYLCSAISNPVFGGLSEGKRIRWICSVLAAAAVAMLVFPWSWGAPGMGLLLIYGFFFLSSYPMVEAALMQSVHDSVRGRVFGLFITIGGLCGNLAHWVVGHWVKDLGSRAYTAESYYSLYATLSLLVALSLLGLPFLHGLRKQEAPAEIFPKALPLDGHV